MRASSMDLRERALLDSAAGMKAADVAAKYRVSGSWVRLLKQRRRDTGEVAPRVQRHGRRCMLEPHLHTWAALIAAHPDRTLAELKDALATPARVPTVWRAGRALQAAGATLWYLPPYSPDLNPIELCFAKLKALVRTARCRRTETLWPFLGECLAHFSPDECRNYFRHCGDSAATRS